MDQQHQEHGRKYGRLIADAWTDDAFKQRLIADPRSVLAERGMSVPEGVEIRVVEDTSQVHYLQIPAKPAEMELSEEMLDRVAGGEACGSCVTVSTATACVE